MNSFIWVNCSLRLLEEGKSFEKIKINNSHIYFADTGNPCWLALPSFCRKNSCFGRSVFKNDKNDYCTVVVCDSCCGNCWAR